MSDVSRLPRAVAETWDWQLRAACRGQDSAVFFHPRNERRNQRVQREARAKQLCARCPVLDRCREHALSVEETFGIWGGLTQVELRSLISRRRRASRRRTP
jgi:WhiB family transcriptional regulator, redox-sensing transcriptional regulator